MHSAGNITVSGNGPEVSSYITCVTAIDRRRCAALGGLCEEQQDGYSAVVLGAALLGLIWVSFAGGWLDWLGTLDTFRWKVGREEVTDVSNHSDKMLRARSSVVSTCEAMPDTASTEEEVLRERRIVIDSEKKNSG